MLIELLQKQTGLTRSQLQRIAKTSSYCYKVYRIPKRTGGDRTIAHPGKKLKAIQRWLNKTVFNSLAVHEGATAYNKGSSIKENATRHANSTFTLRLDFRDFFPSFTSKNIELFLRGINGPQQLGLTDSDIEFICSISTRNDTLAIGAPTSPKITNAMMYDFDDYISSLVTKNQLVYTRYADDLFISSCLPNKLEGVAEEIGDFSKKYEHVTLEINSDKTAFLSRRYRRSITGLIITPDQNVSIGRKRKREIKSLINSYKYGHLEPDRCAYLQGLLAFAMDVEDRFFMSLQAKYGEEILSMILKKNMKDD